ncbi:hypothetical protein [Shimia sp.]|uniref:hypothetical protein n=1 Tax=Shimia sp. TaxID=1954381 RepID=UPI003B8AEEE1
MSDSNVTRGLFESLVHRAGGVECVAALLEARYGKGCKGTVSKMCSGQIGVTVDAAIAVEDFVRAYPITNRMFERKADAEDPELCLRQLAADSMLASGQAHSSLTRAFSSASVDPNGLTSEERVEVIANARAARQQWTDIIEAAEAVE